MHADFLKGTAADGSDKKVRIDLFGMKPNTLDAGTVKVLRPELPVLKPGKSYIVEVIVRTLALGHPLSQGTVDSNEIWVDFQAKAGGKEIARNGATANPDDTGPVDPWAHFINVLMLDRNGNRINRRNPQDIFTPLYNKQIPPGAAAVAHYRLDVPSDVTGPIELNARVRYRKFDYEYMKLVHEGHEPPKLPIVDMCSDHVTCPWRASLRRSRSKRRRSSRSGSAGTIMASHAFWKEAASTATSARRRKRSASCSRWMGLPSGTATSTSRASIIQEGRFDEAAVELDASGKCDPPAPQRGAGPGLPPSSIAERARRRSTATPSLPI